MKMSNSRHREAGAKIQTQNLRTVKKKKSVKYRSIMIHILIHNPENELDL